MVAELMRRHPTRLDVIETHQGGGQADCLTLLQPQRSMLEGSISLNRPGSAHFWRFDGGVEAESWPDVWPALAGADDPREVILELERRAGLVPPVSLARSTRRVLTYRVIAAIIAMGTFGRTLIECRNGFLDSSGSGGSEPRSDFFRAFPEVQARAAESPHNSWSDCAEYHFWFIVRDREPVLALEPRAARAWSREGVTHDLALAWRRAGRRPAVVGSRVAGDLLF